MKNQKTTNYIQKHSKGKKKLLKIFSSVGIICIIAFVIFTIANVTATNIFWNNSDSEIYLDTDEYALDVEYALEEYNQINDNINDIVKYATDISDEEEEFFALYNTYIENYFVEVYGISVQDKIDTIEIKELDISSATEGKDVNITALYVTSYNTIYVSSNEFEILDWYTATIYVHEVIHGLGFDSSGDDTMTYLYEGMAEYITGEILTYNNLEYSNMTVYVENTQIAKQIVLADSSIVKEIVENEKFSLEAWIDEKTSGYAEELENMLFLRNFAGYSDKEILLRAQYITSEYCKAVNFDNAKSIVRNDTIVNYFELSCRLKGWR